MLYNGIHSLTKAENLIEKGQYEYEIHQSTNVNLHSVPCQKNNLKWLPRCVTKKKIVLFVYSKPPLHY